MGCELKKLANFAFILSVLERENPYVQKINKFKGSDTQFMMDLVTHSNKSKVPIANMK